MNQLTPKTINEIGGALQRLAELKQKSIITKEDDQERAATERYIQEQAVLHLNELVACWVAVRQEYEPLLAAVTTVASRVLSVLQQNKETAK